MRSSVPSAWPSNFGHVGGVLGAAFTTSSRQYGWLRIGERVRAFPTRKELLVSNTGPDDDGYSYCVACGRIETAVDAEVNLHQPHSRPYPTDDTEPCPGPVSGLYPAWCVRSNFSPRSWRKRRVRRPSSGVVAEPPATKRTTFCHRASQLDAYSLVVAVVCSIIRAPGHSMSQVHA